MKARDEKKLREANRNFTVGEPPKFTELQSLCRRIGKSPIARLVRWGKVWSGKIKVLQRLHESYCKSDDKPDPGKSPFLRKLSIFRGAVEYLKGEVRARQSGNINTVNASQYDPDIIIRD